MYFLLCWSSEKSMKVTDNMMQKVKGYKATASIQL